MKAHLIDTHLLVPRSRSSAKVKVKYQGHVSQKMGVSGALVFHKNILFFLGACLEDKLFPKTNSLHDGRAQPLADIEEFSLKIKVKR